MASKVVIIAKESEPYESIIVEIKLSGISPDETKSSDKVFHLGGREYPMARFGSWVMQEIQDEVAIASLISDAGVVAAVTWAFSQAYSKVTVWVKSTQDCQFHLEMEKSIKGSVMDDIATGQMAIQLEARLESLKEVEPFSEVKVTAVEIVESDSAKKRYVNDVRNRFPEAIRLNRLAEMERVANLMKRSDYSQALTVLKSCLSREKEDIHRLQMSLRLSICALHVTNENEWRTAVTETQSLMKTVDVPVEEITLYQKEYEKLFSLLLHKQSAVLAIEVSFAFAEIVKKVPNPVERLDNISMILSRINKAMKILISIDPCACLKSDHLHNIDRMSEQIEFMQSQSGCDPLVKAQSIYYVEFIAAEMRAAVEKQKESIFREDSADFKRITSCWADLPFVITRLRLHPEVRKFLDDDAFRMKVIMICKNPPLLQQHLKDSKIAKANEVLMSEFGIFSSAGDINEAMNATGLGASNSEAKAPNEPEKPLDKKQQAQLEKEKGNEAYKNQEFSKAHIYYDRAICLDPEDAMLHSNKAAVFISQENLEMAKIACVHAINLAQKNGRHDKADEAKIFARLAKVEFLDKSPEKAVLLCQKSLSLNFDPKVEELKKECETAAIASMFLKSHFME